MSTTDASPDRHRRAAARRTAWLVAAAAALVYLGFMTMPWWSR